MRFINNNYTVNSLTFKISMHFLYMKVTYNQNRSFIFNFFFCINLTDFLKILCTDKTSANIKSLH